MHEENVHEEQKTLNDKKETVNKVDAFEQNTSKVNVTNNAMILKKFACHMCKNSFDLPMSLKEHILANHESLKIYNDFVKNMFEKNNKSSKLPSDSNGKKPINNEGEEKKGVDVGKKGILAHKLSVHEELKNTMYQTCWQCNRQIKGSRELKRHIETVHEKLKNFECDHCGKKFTRKTNLLHHKKTAHQKI